MKKILSVFTLFVSLGLYAEEKNNIVVLLNANSTHYVFENKVNIREKPNLSARIIDKAVIGEKVQIIQQSQNMEEIEGLVAYWYQIRHNDNFGFMWGGLISTLEAAHDFDGNKKEEILMSRGTANHECALNDYKTQYYFDSRLCRIGYLLNESPFDTKPLEPGDNYNVLDYLGFKPNVPILSISSSYGDGDSSASRTQLYYLVKNEFHLLLEFHESSSPEEMESIDLKFPNQSNVSNTIILTDTVVALDNSTGKRKKEDITKTLIVWNGVTFQKR